MALKRKRGGASTTVSTTSDSATLTTTSSMLSKLAVSNDTHSFQIILGTYDRVLHGIRVSVPSDALQKSKIVASAASTSSSDLPVTFKDLYLFHAHTSSIRCLAVSPISGTKKRILATSSPDTKINLYHMHTRRSLGNLTPPTAATTTVLHFASTKTLLSGDEDGRIHIWRTRDWSLLSTLKSPAPKAIKNRGGVEAMGGINDLAVHPSGKIALSVSRNERAVRLWNLMTGRKAGVMTFGKDVPRSMTLGGSGEGAKVRWTAGEGEEAGYAVAFDRGVVIFGMDARPHFHITPSPPTKIHQIHFFKLAAHPSELLFVSTEDGRVLIYALPSISSSTTSESIPLLGTVGGKFAAMTTRVKDIDVLELGTRTILATACSDGMVRVWELNLSSEANQLSEPEPKKSKTDGQKEEKTSGKDVEITSPAIVMTEEIAPDLSIGVLIGFTETGRRITCMKAAEVQEATATDVDYDEMGDEVGSESDSEDDDED